MKKKTFRKINLFMLCAIFTFLISACSGVKEKSSYDYKIPADLGDGWETASLQEARLDSKKLAAMMDNIQKGGFENLHSLMIVKDGRLVFEEYFRGHNPQGIDDVASVTKSVTSILVGIAIDRGFIESSHQYLSQLLPSYSDIINSDPLKQKLQLWYLLTMTSGLEWDEETLPYGDLRNDATAMEASPDAVKFVLNRPVVREPGKQFQYCACNSMLLSAILEEATGMTAAEFGKLYLFEPLGISQYHWNSYADGHTHTDGGLSLRPRDMAKIGLLMLNNGQWKGNRIVSESWIAESTQARETVGLGVQYGYQWWREKESILLENIETYFAAGFGGQLINIYPDQNMILIFTSDTSNHDENSARIMFLRSRYILPAAIPALSSKTILWAWYILTTGGLFFLILEIIRGKIQGFGLALLWLLIGTIFGPLGMTTYILSFRNQKTMQAQVWKALGIAAFLATGNITGIILLTIFQVLFLPEGIVLFLLVPASFLVSWVVFIAPLTASTQRIHYRKALIQTLLIAFIATCFTLAGIIPLLIVVVVKWTLTGYGLTIALVWFMITISNIVGMMIVYPFSLWMAHYKLDFWPANEADGFEIKFAEADKRLPQFRDAWGALLLSLFLLIATFGLSIMYISSRS